MAQINWTNITDFSGILLAANTASGGFFWSMICYLLFVVILLMGIDFGLTTAAMMAAVVCIVICLPLLYAGLISNWVIGSFVGIAIFSMLAIIWSSKSDN